MNKKIQLLHPAGKKAVSMDPEKYSILKKALVTFLSINGESTHTGIIQAITEDIKRNKIVIEGSVAWHLEWVMLDLEARNEISRISRETPITFKIAGKS